MMNIEGMQPLSLEQAQKMNGKPVWYEQMKQWFIIAINHKNWGDCIVGANTYAPLENAVAVSYTHLDVYKRQSGCLAAARLSDCDGK